MKNIEVEVRSFITKDQYEKLISFFKENAKFINEDYQETYYFDTKEDLRIQRNNFFSKIWLKKGEIHDNWREEIEIKFNRNDFEKLENLFISLGLKVQIKWFRKRHTFEWQDTKVCLDYTKGYGYIIEVEKLCSEKEKENILKVIQQQMQNIGISLTPKEEFDKKYQYYKKNWRKLGG
ncbi:CYTH domain-containing protein [candidate division WOR-3 bacterium]|nr:CYTH domain-containing protein [candidate division WOR-3 bacterium]